MTAPLLGLLGKKRTGKNTAAKHLARFGYKEAAFADPLRDMALAIDPVVGTTRDAETGDTRLLYYSEALTIYGYEKAKEHFPEFRRFLQRLGTEGVRDVLGRQYGLRDLIGGDVWPVLAELRIIKAQGKGESLVFTDVRFPNEAALIERHDGYTVRVERPGIAPTGDNHPSETALDDYTPLRTIINPSTPTGMSEAVDELIDSL